MDIIINSRPTLKSGRLKGGIPGEFSEYSVRPMCLKVHASEKNDAALALYKSVQTLM